LFLQNTLLVKPGVTQGLNIVNYLLKNLPGYEKDGSSVSSLCTASFSIFSESERIGVNKFADIVRLITEQGKSNAKLSIYYLQLQSFGNIYV
jgi:hypothetical protein